jgi:hypothetical protein
LQSKEATSEKIGKTANETAIEAICRETGILFSMVATWTSKKGQIGTQKMKPF